MIRGRTRNFGKSKPVDQLELGNSGMINDINCAITDLVGNDTWYVDRIRRSTNTDNDVWYIDASNDNGKKHKMFQMIHSKPGTIEEIESDETNESFEVIYLSSESNFSNSKKVNSPIKLKSSRRSRIRNYSYTKKFVDIEISEDAAMDIIEAIGLEDIDGTGTYPCSDIAGGFEVLKQRGNTYYLKGYITQFVESILKKNNVDFSRKGTRNYSASANFKVGDTFWTTWDGAQLVRIVDIDGDEVLVHRVDPNTGDIIPFDNDYGEGPYAFTLDILADLYSSTPYKGLDKYVTKNNKLFARNRNFSLSKVERNRLITFLANGDSKAVELYKKDSDDSIKDEVNYQLEIRGEDQITVEDILTGKCNDMLDYSGLEIDGNFSVRLPIRSKHA